MNAISFGFGAAAGKGPGMISNRSNPDRPLDAAWIVLEAANDLGDHATVEICRRVIDADLNGMPASQSDLHIVLDYFR
jgi:hypothetical protein